MKEYARGFYSSKAWKDTREAYKKYRGGLCETCLSKGIYKAGEIVHLSFDNLLLVCRDCHAAEHDARRRRYKIDELGRVITRGE